MSTLPIAGRAGPAILVACVDLGVNTRIAAFTESYVSSGASYRFKKQGGTSAAYDHKDLRNHLAPDLTAALRSGPVALGIEGPLWGHSDGRTGPYRPRPFEDGYRAWFGGSGGPAAIKAFATVLDLLELISPAVNCVTNALPVGTPIPWEPGTLLLWEAFVTGEYKPGDGLANARDLRGRSGGKWAAGQNKDVDDAVWAVRMGFCNDPAPDLHERNGWAAGVAMRGRVSIAGAAVRAVQRSWIGPDWSEWDCLVIAPKEGRANLKWP